MSAAAGAVRSGASIAVADLERMVGEVIGVSGWRTVGQADIDAFAAVTDDPQFIHVDPERAAAETTYGGTIAHGFLTLSLLSTLGRDAIPPIAGRRIGVNYGLDRVRFLSPVRAGARIRGSFVLQEVLRRTPTEIRLTYRVTVEIEYAAKPALVADWLSLAVLAGP